LNLTIIDTNGTPISGATVSITQSEEKEFFVFSTDNDGKIDAIHEIQCALLTNKHQYGSNKTTNVEY